VAAECGEAFGPQAADHLCCPGRNLSVLCVLLADAAGMARDAEKDGQGHIRSRGDSGRDFRVDRVVIAGAACVFLIARARRISPSLLPLSQTLAGRAVHELAEDGAERAAGAWLRW
jgi:hypothetical protein